MGTRLTYPPLPDGYRWNILQKIYLKIGKWPGSATTSSETIFNFIEDLSAQEITDVDDLIGDGSTCQDPIKFGIINNTYILKDVYEYRDQLEADAGYNIAITYRSSGTISGTVYDEIVLQPTDPTYQAVKILTNPQKNALASAVENLGRWE